MPNVVRAILWVILLVAPGGVLLLPLLLGDQARRAKRRKEEQAQVPNLVKAESIPAPASGRLS